MLKDIYKIVIRKIKKMTTSPEEVARIEAEKAERARIRAEEKAKNWKRKKPENIEN